MNIEIKNIRKSYGRKEVLKDITFKAEGGECVGILGGNGCGKSTLLSILGGVRRPSDGSFIIDGEDMLRNHKMRSSTVGYLPQGTPLLEELSAYDNLRLWYDKAALENELSEGKLHMLGIDSFLKVPVHKMSGGMKKRLSIGCAVAHTPKLLLLDEPSSALDLICKENIRDFIISHKQSGGTVFLTTHDERELTLCDRLYIIKGGISVPTEFTGDIGALVEKF